MACSAVSLPLLFLLLLGGVAVSAGLLDCDNMLRDSTSFSGLCSNKWKNLKPLLRPTQAQVGFAWIQYKLDRDFTSSKEAQSAMDGSPTPAVVGPGTLLYVVDDHHTLSALDFSGYEDTKVTISVLCDLRHLPEQDFWQSLSKQNLVFLANHPAGQPNALPLPISYKDLPSSFSFAKSVSFSDDPWRALAGFSRKVKRAADPAPACSGNDGNYCQRCMLRGCVDGYRMQGSSVPFFEFRWSYFLNDATFYNTQYWPSPAFRSAFKRAYDALPPSKVGKVNTDEWLAAAENVIALCRSDASAHYLLPSHLFSNSSLPGYFRGYQKLGDDPTCDPPTCKALF